MTTFLLKLLPNNSRGQDSLSVNRVPLSKILQFSNLYSPATACGLQALAGEGEGGGGGERRGGVGRGGVGRGGEGRGGEGFLPLLHPVAIYPSQRYHRELSLLLTFLLNYHPDQSNQHITEDNFLMLLI